MQKYYVYEFYIIETGEVIYVGKGTGKRYKCKCQRNKFLTEMLKRFNCDSRIVKRFEDEGEAFKYEYQRINELKTIGQCVCNIHSGGAGGSGEYWTDDLRKEYSEHNVMKSVQQRQRMSVNNPMKNPSVSERVNQKKRKPVLIGKTEYVSVTEASQKENVAVDTIVNWCRKGINAKGQKCKYKNQPQVEFHDKRYNKGGCKAVVFRGVEYESVIDFADAVGISQSAAHEWLKRGFNPKAEPCRYKDDNREPVFTDRFIQRNKAKAKSIIVNGVQYTNWEDACKQLNLNRSTLYSYLNGSRHSKKYNCKYGNQQPSQGNVNNSTLDGSTTNG